MTGGDDVSTRHASVMIDEILKTIVVKLVSSHIFVYTVV